MRKVKESPIVQYFHCKECIDIIPEGVSPEEYARISVGFTKKGLQVWCSRHGKNIVHLDFLGQKVGLL